MSLRKQGTNLILAVLAVILIAAWALAPVGSVSASPISTTDSSSSVLIAQVDNQPPDETDPDVQPTQPPVEGDEPLEEDQELTIEQTCEGSFVGLGWIMCQITRAIYGFFDYLVHNVLAPGLLEIDLINDEPALKQIWSSFKTISNLLFVIGFLIIIYAEASGRYNNLEAYSINRILPRIIFAAIGIQLSYFIVGYMIALFNDFGAGTTQLVLAPLEGFSQFELAGVFSNLTDGDTWFGLAVNTGGNIVDNLAALMAAGAIGIAGVIFLPTILLYGLLGLLLLFLVLMARKIFVLVLVILAPIAFAMFILPNTERFFRQWWDLLLKTLFMYPLIMLFIGAGQLLGRLAIAGDDTTFIDSMIGFTAVFLPLFMIPITFRLAGSVLSGISGTLRALNEKAKGDTRDPRSVRTNLRNARGRAWNRMMSGAQPGIPEPVRRRVKRMPFVDSRAPLIAEMAEGDQWAKGYQTTGHDDVLRAIAVTGGGRWQGRAVTLSDGSTSYTGWAKLGKQIARDQRGNLILDRNGSVQLRGSDGSLKETKAGDFYSAEIISEVKSMNMNRGRLSAASIYSMGKATDEYSQSQVMHGLRASRWTSGELKEYVNGVWALNRRDKPHLKFLDYDYFDEKPDRNQDSPVVQGAHMGTQPSKLKQRFADYAQYMDEEIRGFDASYFQGSSWRYAQQGLSLYSADEIRSDARLNTQVQGMYNRAVASTGRGIPQYDEEGNQVGFSEATQEAKREMQAFVAQYENMFGVQRGRGNQPPPAPPPTSPGPQQPPSSNPPPPFEPPSQPTEPDRPSHDPYA